MGGQVAKEVGARSLGSDPLEVAQQDGRGRGRSVRSKSEPLLERNLLNVVLQSSTRADAAAPLMYRGLA